MTDYTLYNNSIFSGVSETHQWALLKTCIFKKSCLKNGI